MKRFLFLFCIGAAGYSLIELLWRGFTHWTMGLTGGVCFPVLCGIHKRLGHQVIWVRCFVGSLFITVTEFLVGCLVNLKLHWSVWDYSDLRFQLLGQICLPYSILWYFLTIPVFFLAEFLRRPEHHQKYDS